MSGRTFSPDPSQGGKSRHHHPALAISSLLSVNTYHSENGTVMSFVDRHFNPGSRESSDGSRFYPAHCRVSVTWENACFQSYPTCCPIPATKCAAISCCEKQLPPDVGPFASKKKLLAELSFFSLQSTFKTPKFSLHFNKGLYVFDINQESLPTPLILFLCLVLSLWSF